MPKYKLLKEAYAIIDGIPEDRFNLNFINKNDRGGPRNDPHHCGTIGCAIGWLAMHPKMQALGLGYEETGVCLMFKGAELLGYESAAMRLFNITHTDARNLFGSEGLSRYDRDATSLRNNHKALFRHRVKAFLREHGQL
jgi:hypothetical protein